MEDEIKKVKEATIQFDSLLRITVVQEPFMNQQRTTIDLLVADVAMLPLLTLMNNLHEFLYVAGLKPR